MVSEVVELYITSSAWCMFFHHRPYHVLRAIYMIIPLAGCYLWTSWSHDELHTKCLHLWLWWQRYKGILIMIENLKVLHVNINCCYLMASEINGLYITSSAWCMFSHQRPYHFIRGIVNYIISWTLPVDKLDPRYELHTKGMHLWLWWNNLERDYLVERLKLTFHLSSTRVFW